MQLNRQISTLLKDFQSDKLEFAPVKMEGDLEFEDSPESRFFLENLKRIRSTKEVSLKSGSSDEFQDTADNLVDGFGHLKIRHSHAVTLDTSENSDHELDISPGAFAEPIKWKHGLDHAAWCRKKKNEDAKKNQKGVKSGAEECMVPKEMQKAEQQKRAMAHWVEQKKKEQQRREHVERRTQEMRQKLEEQKNAIARQKFSEWYNKKELERLSKPDSGELERKFRKEAAERKKKLSYKIGWDEWVQQKKQQTIPTKFTHNDYPEPGWINPNPWIE